MSSKKIIIAIDGYSSSGKSTMARHLAAAIGYRYIDSGAMYRAVTLMAIRLGLIAPDGTVDEAALVQALPDMHVDFRPAPGGQATLLNGQDVESQIRSMEVSGQVSLIAAIPAVRHALVQWQRDLGSQRGIVMDGRDIGTVVFPDAEMKVFCDASPEKRAQRRFAELKAKGDDVTLQQVLQNVLERDRIDTTRKESPLRCAPDAVRLDNSEMTPEQQNQWLLSLYNSIVDKQ